MEKKLSRQEREKIQIEQTILQHAENLFRQNGYTNTSMDALSVNCEYTKRTIYRYFTCKEDLYFAVLLKGHIALLEAVKSKTQDGKTGREKIALAFKAYSDFFTQDNSQFDLMSQIKAIKSEKKPNELPYFKKYVDCADSIHKEIITLFMMAGNDKSIRTDVDASQLGFSSIFMLEGFYHMLSLMGDSFTEHFSLNKDQFTEFTLKLIFQLLEDVLK